MCDICGSKSAAVNSVVIASIAGPTTVHICTEFHSRLNEAKKARAATMLRDLAATIEIPAWPEEAKPEAKVETRGWKKSKR